MSDGQLETLRDLLESAVFANHISKADPTTSLGVLESVESLILQMEDLEYSANNYVSPEAKSLKGLKGDLGIE